ncbi:hypothetical protein FACS18945_3640 [Bacteroidia bacterium]|nr:hypothetical protein FACS18945_3640 [Bacteroidia bacterium]
MKKTVTYDNFQDAMKYVAQRMQKSLVKSITIKIIKQDQNIEYGSMLKNGLAQTRDRIKKTRESKTIPMPDQKQTAPANSKKSVKFKPAKKDLMNWLANQKYRNAA